MIKSTAVQIAHNRDKKITHSTFHECKTDFKLKVLLNSESL